MPNPSSIAEREQAEETNRVAVTEARSAEGGQNIASSVFVTFNSDEPVRAWSNKADARMDMMMSDDIEGWKEVPVQ